MNPRIRQIVAALLATAAAACSARQRAAQPTAPQVTRASSETEAIAKAKADSARYPYTAADVHFMSGMIGHHAQALEMAALVPTHGASASIRILAERIINAQQDEITIMQQWLR